MEHDERADRMEHEAADMEERADKLGEHIQETRRDWHAKEQDPSVPGARPDPATPGKESDQLPEEAPAEQVPDDDASPARPEAEDSPATGTPDAAGSDE